MTDDYIFEDTPEETARRQAREREIIDNFRLMDDDFMSVVFNGENELTALVLRIILEKDDLTVTSVETHVEYKNAVKRSIILDVKAIDSKKRVYNIEVQRSDRGAGVRRARYYSSMIDSELLEKAKDFDEIADTYVIFITEHDKYRRGLPMYHVDRTIRELDHEDFGDGAHIIYVNGEYRSKNDPVGRLMHDFNCSKAGDMVYPVLADRVRYFKETEGGYGQMCRAMEEFIQDERDAAEKKGEKKKAISIAIQMLMDGVLSNEKISLYSTLSLDEVRKLALSLNN